MVYADSKVISKINDKGKEIVVNTITYQQFNKNVKE